MGWWPWWGLHLVFKNLEHRGWEGKCFEFSAHMTRISENLIKLLRWKQKLNYLCCHGDLQKLEVNVKSGQHSDIVPKLDHLQRQLDHFPCSLLWSSQYPAGHPWNKLPVTLFRVNVPKVNGKRMDRKMIEEKLFGSNYRNSRHKYEKIIWGRGKLL